MNVQQSLLLLTMSIGYVGKNAFILWIALNLVIYRVSSYGQKVMIIVASVTVRSKTLS